VGLDALTRLSRADAALVVLGDQPDVRPPWSRRWSRRMRATHARAVVPKYRYSWGNPVLLDRRLWTRIMSLEGDEGAGRLLQAHPEWVEEVWVERLPPRDVDTEADVAELRPRRPG
jgi:molybdenum cofactor cytidylyltransferase